jgi:hypothetical protein
MLLRSIVAFCSAKVAVGHDIGIEASLGRASIARGSVRLRIKKNETSVDFFNAATFPKI